MSCSLPRPHFHRRSGTSLKFVQSKAEHTWEVDSYTRLLSREHSTTQGLIVTVEEGPVSYPPSTPTLSSGIPPDQIFIQAAAIKATREEPERFTAADGALVAFRSFATVTECLLFAGRKVTCCLVTGAGWLIGGIKGSLRYAHENLCNRTITPSQHPASMSPQQHQVQNGLPLKVYVIKDATACADCLSQYLHVPARHPRLSGECIGSVAFTLLVQYYLLGSVGVVLLSVPRMMGSKPYITFDASSNMVTRPHAAIDNTRAKPERSFTADGARVAIRSFATVTECLLFAGRKVTCCLVTGAGWLIGGIKGSLRYAHENLCNRTITPSQHPASMSPQQHQVQNGLPLKVYVIKDATACADCLSQYLHVPARHPRLSGECIGSVAFTLLVQYYLLGPVGVILLSVPRMTGTKPYITFNMSSNEVARPRATEQAVFARIKQDTQCAEINRQKIEGESPSSGKVWQTAGTPSHGRLPVMAMVER